jgi:23S rRNA pseudouridine1911/1915/1917 synthase
MSRDYEASENVFVMKWTVENGEAGQRLDHFLKEKYRKRSREFIQRAIRDGLIKLNHEPSKPSRILRPQDKVYVTSIKKNEPEVDFNYSVIYEDDCLMVINKPGNLPVHPTGRFFFNTLLTRLQSDNSNEIDANRLFYIVHRVDRETSGVLVVGKDKEASAHLTDQFIERKTEKEYLAIARGVMPEDHYLVKAPLSKDQKSSLELRMAAVEVDAEGKPLYLHEDAVLHAETDIRVVERVGDYTIVRVRPHTGRQHQIRVHLDHIGFPIAGDKLYGQTNLDAFYRNLRGEGRGVQVEPGVFLERHALHAAKLGFTHPRTNQWMEFEAPLSPELIDFLEKVREPKSERGRRMEPVLTL